MATDVKVTVDGRTVTVPATANALEACRAAGVDVPHFCYHPALSIVGQCRMCMVEIEGMPKIQASCTVPIREGMVIKASSEKALAARNATMEFLLINHPLDCPICDQAGECKLQDNAFAAGLPVSRMAEKRRQFPGYDRTEIGPHVIADMTRCIQCTRCIRFCREITGTSELTFVERAGHTLVWTHEGMQLENEMSACAADVCPVGALTVKEFRFRKRVWWLDKARSVCEGCEVGCNISIEHRDRLVYRFLPRVNPAVNDYWMCDYGRFLSEQLNDQEFLKPQIPGGNTRTETNWGVASTLVADALEKAAKGSVLALGSARLSTEESWLLVQLFGAKLGAAVEFGVDGGPRRRVKNPKAAGAKDGWLEGFEQAPNSRGAEAAGAVRAGKGSKLEALLNGTFLPEVLYVADAGFTAKANDPTFVAHLRKAKLLVVHARVKNALTDAADVVLPVTGIHGKDGTFVNVQGRIQRFEMAFVPPPIVRSDLEVLLHLGKRFGLWDTRLTARDVFEEMKKSVPSYATAAWDELIGNEASIAPADAYDVLLSPEAPKQDSTMPVKPVAGAVP